jgi:hypothetical protein
LQDYRFDGGVVEDSEWLVTQLRLVTRDRLQIKIWQQNRGEHFIR